jgi:hypothetical protein
VYIVTTTDLDVFDLLGSTVLIDSVFVWAWGFTHAISGLHAARQFILYRGAVKSLARPGRKNATATEDFDVYISYL